MFYLYKTAIIGFHVSENIKREHMAVAQPPVKIYSQNLVLTYNISKRHVWEAFLQYKKVL